jgi:hypothetical protein
MSKMVTRQDAAKAVLLNTPDSEQVEKMVQMHLGKYIQVTPNKVVLAKLSPQQIVDRREFLNEKGQALYSVEQVRKILIEQVGGEAEADMAQTSPPSRKDTTAATQSIPAATSPPMLTGSSKALSTTSSSSKVVISVVYEASSSPLTIRLRMQSDWTLQDVTQQLTDHCALTTPHSFKLQFEHEGGGAEILTDMEDVWEVIRDTQASGRWVFRSIMPATPQQERMVIGPTSVTSESVTRRLSYDNPESDSMTQLTKALRLQQFEQSVMAEIKAAVKSAVTQYGEKVGKAGNSPAETFYTALRVTEDLTKLLERLNKQASRREDPTAEQQRLQWFIEAILDLLEDDVKQRWQGQDDPEHREASHYTSWAQFRAILFTIIRNITDFTPDGLMDQLPNLVVPAKCASRNDLWVAIEQVQAAAKTLAEMKAIDATAQIEASTVKYLAASLTAEATKGIIEALANKHRAEASTYYSQIQHPPLTAYPSRCIKGVMLGRDDFEGNWRADWRVSPGRDLSAQSGKVSGNSNQRAEKKTLSDQGSSSPRTRVLKRNQQSYVFPIHLKDVSDAGERKSLEKNFLANTLLDWKCHKCGVNGHTQEICPQFFKLDNRSIEHNPRSFFFGLRPPQQVLNLSKQAMVMPVLETKPHTSAQEPAAGASTHGPVQLSSIELDPQELQAFHAWRAGQQLGN